MWADVAAGALASLEWQNLLLMFLGTGAGILVGAIPGLTATMAIAVLLPLTFTLEPAGAMLFLLGIYAGGIFGGSVTAILINTPGTPAAAATLLDGYPLARQGRAMDALKMSIYASVIGGLVSAVALLLTAPLIARMALRFGPPEYFALAVFGLSIIATVSARNVLKGMISAAIGLFIATIGLDRVDGLPRFTFDIQQLTAGIPLIPALIGLFAVGEILQKAATPPKMTDEAALANSEFGLRSIGPYLSTILRGSGIGVVIGAIPGTGALIAAFISYNEARRRSANPDRYGKGELDGVAAAESANNGTTGATLIPLLTLGIPGDALTAVLVGALLLHGLTPGPALFSEQGVYVYTIITGFFTVNLILLIQARLAVPIFSYVTRIPDAYLSPLILMFCVAGAYAVNNSMFDVWLMGAFGILGFLMPRLGLPVTPLLLALILGPMAETALRQSLVISNANPFVFVQRPLSLAFLVVTFVSLLLPILRSRGLLPRRGCSRSRKESS